ncbi:hypothetical protein [Actinomadura rupiterrae]|uniref:hypothetical protein n=1 Tax=Actinomadura rupiterrae TaxID=559627 RepID=UPI0020A386DE|nr:hypothetical protein [Actinomadura rupiterrae]MCP2340587.1 carboxylesterase type B [Actinomadura rupiterrae]
MTSEPEREGLPEARLDELAGGSEDGKPGAAALVLAEAMTETADLFRKAVSASGTLPVEQTNELLSWLFDIFDQLLGLLWDAGESLNAIHHATVSDGPVWDDANAAQARAKLHALDQAMVNLSSCRDTLGGAHMLLSHAQSELDRVEIIDGTAGRPAEKTL